MRWCHQSPTRNETKKLRNKQGRRGSGPSTPYPELAFHFSDCGTIRTADDGGEGFSRWTRPANCEFRSGAEGQVLLEDSSKISVNGADSSTVLYTLKPFFQPCNTLSTALWLNPIPLDSSGHGRGSCRSGILIIDKIFDSSFLGFLLLEITWAGNIAKTPDE